MKVKDLMEDLAKLNPEATVFVYSNEYADRASEVYDKEDGADLYCKSSTIPEIADKNEDYVVIG